MRENLGVICHLEIFPNPVGAGDQQISCRQLRAMILGCSDTDDIWAARDLDMAFELLNASGANAEELERGGDAKIASDYRP